MATVTSGTPTPTWSLILGDGQGSAQVAMQLVPQASGTGLEPASASHTVTRNAYLPFGATRGGDNLATSRGWLGQVADTDTGLIYLNARYYDPVLARFVSPDPLMNPGDPKTLDPYRYADNNPVMATDASGLAACYGLSAAAEKKCMGVYDKGSGYKPQAAGTHTPQKVKYDSLGAPIPSAQHSRNVIAQLAKDQAAAPSQLQVWLTPTKSTYMSGLQGEVNFLGGALNGATSMINGVTSVVPQFRMLESATGVSLKIPSVGIWGDYDKYKYSSWLGTADFTLTTFVFGGEGAAGTKAVEGIEGLEGATEVEAATSTVVRDAAESCLNSFTADTPVLMADGTEKAIADVKVGDKVLATDPETGVSKAKPVTALIRHGGKHTMVEFTLADGSVLTSTDRHPIWDATTTTFTDAINLRMGEDLLGANGQLLAITGERIYDQDLTTYNLQIDGIHTYYAGSTPVLVHNSCFKMNREIANKEAPKGIDRVCAADCKIPGNQDHVHFDGSRATLNRDGTWGHGGEGSPTNAQLRWLRKWGWNV